MDRPALDALSPDELLARYRAGELAAFEAFFRRTRPVVFNYLLARLKRREEADEAFQETYFRIHRHVLRYDPAQKAMGWVMTIARHAMIDVLAKRRAHEPLDEARAVALAPPAEGDPPDALDAAQTLERLLAALSPDDQALVRERYLEDATYADVAARRGITEVNARQRLSRVLRRLRGAVKG